MPPTSLTLSPSPPSLTHSAFVTLAFFLLLRHAPHSSIFKRCTLAVSSAAYPFSCRSHSLLPRLWPFLSVTFSVRSSPAILFKMETSSCLTSPAIPVYLSVLYFPPFFLSDVQYHPSSSHLILFILLIVCLTSLECNLCEGTNFHLFCVVVSPALRIIQGRHSKNSC